ncbi:MAG: SAM-dependent methyltransferase [Bacteroidetes bacterium]|nr:MAG: SAM-dependent methyltransferase [Bacteroidota bacterium]
MPSLDPDFWEERYRQGDTPWDIGAPSPPLMNYTRRATTPETRILIPGAGRAYEAAELHRRGYRHLFVCDWAPSAFRHLLDQAPDFPREHLLVQDFFQLALEVDLILEQTFFCALDPALRPRYVDKCAELLAPGGRLAGVLFASPFEREGPPFGGTADEYRRLFAPRFHILQMELCEDSIEPRKGNELFVLLEKKLQG